MKKKIGDFFGRLLGYLIVFNVLFSAPMTVYCWRMNRKKIKEVDERVDELRELVLPTGEDK